jgi:ABC-2 type transport system ATP-binding protein
MIQARNRTKHYGSTVAVDDLSFDVRPGMVTGFLGPNGAGKTTTMRMILRLDHSNSGQTTIDGKEYRDLPAPPARSGRAARRQGAAGAGVRPPVRHESYFGIFYML